MTRWQTIDGLRVKVGGSLWRYLRRNRKRIEGKTTSKAPPAHLGKRQAVVHFAHWAVVHTGKIHYRETRPIPQVKPETLPRLPFTTDCSGFATMAYQYAAAADPNGLAYNGQGYTGTILDHAYKHGHVLTDVAKAKPGDLIVYGPGQGEHVAVIVEAGKDPLTVSHGQESEPGFVRVSQDGRMPQRICRTLPA